MDISHLQLPDFAVPPPRTTRSPSQDAHSAYEPSVERLEMNSAADRRRKPRKLVLCFDGTGNKFRGDDSDSNSMS